MTAYGDRDLDQYWISSWLVAWRHQAITWINVVLSSVKSGDNHTERTISQDTSSLNLHHSDNLMSAMASQISASRFFTQPFVQAQIKNNIKAPPHWPLWGEYTGGRWNPLTKGQQRRKCFHLMTSWIENHWSKILFKSPSGQSVGDQTTRSCGLSKQFCPVCHFIRFSLSSK